MHANGHLDSVQLQALQELIEAKVCKAKLLPERVVWMGKVANTTGPPAQWRGAALNRPPRAPDSLLTVAS